MSDSDNDLLPQDDNESREENPTYALLHQSGDPFRLLVQAVGDYAIFILDTKGYIVTWNLGAQKIKGYQAAEIIGKHFSTFYTEEDLQWDKPGYELKVEKCLPIISTAW